MNALILSDKNDTSTNKVISYFSQSTTFLRLNESDVSFFESDESNKFLKNCSELSFIWLRRGDFPRPPTFHKELLNEYNVLKRYYHYLVESHPHCVGSLVREYDHNKLIDLEKARQCEIKTPKTFIAFNNIVAENVLSEFDKKSFITKAINDPIRFENKVDVIYGGFTSEIEKVDLNNRPFKFPSLIQEKIEKQFEIRSFFIRGVFFSMAIFSQNDDQTKVDFRHYNNSKPNRNVPFRLPKYMEEKLTKLMRKLELNTGSIDLIYSTDNEFVFLEVNPCGQFGWVSENCNYYIEKHIAKVLVNG